MKFNGTKLGLSRHTRGYFFNRKVRLMGTNRYKELQITREMQWLAVFYYMHGHDARASEILQCLRNRTGSGDLHESTGAQESTAGDGKMQAAE